MMTLKMKLNQHCEALLNKKMPTTKKECFQVLYDMFLNNPKVIAKQYEIWKTLNSAASAYSDPDSRRITLDLETLDKMQDFESVELI